MASTVGQAAADQGANGNHHSLPGVQVIHLNPIRCRPILRSATIAVFGMKPIQRMEQTALYMRLLLVQSRH